MEKEKLSLRGIIFAGIKKFAGEIIGVVLLACFLWAFPGFRSLFTDHTFPKKDESQAKVQRELEAHKQEEERLKAELKRKEEALRESEAKKAEEERRRAELQRQIEAQKAVTAEKTKPAPTPKHPIISDYDFIALCKLGNPRSVEEAIKNGTNVNAKDNDGWTALMRAAWEDHAEVVEVLLKHGADVNAKNNKGMTALMWAAQRGYADVAEVLLKHGANVSTKDNNGNTAMKLANNVEVRKLLRRYRAK